MSKDEQPLSFKEAIEMGMYDEDFLGKYAEWKTMNEHIRFQFISQALANRRRQLRLQWAGLANQLDFSKKPHLADAQRKVEAALHDLNDDEEKLFVKYAGK